MGQGIAGIRDSEREGEPDDRVHERVLQSVDASLLSDAPGCSGHAGSVHPAVAVVMRNADHAVPHRHREIADRVVALASDAVV